MRHLAVRPMAMGGAAAALLLGAAQAGAMPRVPEVPTGPAAPMVERIANGCGPGYFRTTAGQCFPNERFIGPYGGVRAPPPCPPGYLRSPYRPLCYPVR